MRALVVVMLVVVAGLVAPRRAAAQGCPDGSRFWLQLDALCRVPTPPAELDIYCAGGDAPSWASAPEPERLARVDALAQEAAVDLSAVAATRITAEAGRLIPDAPDELATGAGVDLLLAELHAWLCAQEGATPWLDATCATPLEGEALRELRVRVLRDLGLLPTRAMAELASTRDAEVAHLTQAMVETLLGPARPLDLAWALAKAASMDCASATGAPTSRIEGLTSLLVRIAVDVPHVDRLSPQHWAQLLTSELSRLGLPALTKPERRRIAAELSDLGAALRRLEVEPPSPGLRRNHARASST